MATTHVYITQEDICKLMSGEKLEIPVTSGIKNSDTIILRPVHETLREDMFKQTLMGVPVSEENCKKRRVIITPGTCYLGEDVREKRVKKFTKAIMESLGVGRE